MSVREFRKDCLVAVGFVHFVQFSFEQNLSFLISSALAYFYVDIADLDLHARSEIGNKKIERFVYNPKESLSRLLPSFLLPSELLVPHFVFHIEDLNFVVAKIGLIHLLV